MTELFLLDRAVPQQNFGSRLWQTYPIPNCDVKCQPQCVKQCGAIEDPRSANDTIIIRELVLFSYLGVSLLKI